jgi:hypothetical protein
MNLRACLFGTSSPRGSLQCRLFATNPNPRLPRPMRPLAATSCWPSAQGPVACRRVSANRSEPAVLEQALLVNRRQIWMLRGRRKEAGSSASQAWREMKAWAAFFWLRLLRLRRAWPVVCFQKNKVKSASVCKRTFKRFLRAAMISNSCSFGGPFLAAGFFSPAATFFSVVPLRIAANKGLSAPS